MIALLFFPIYILFNYLLCKIVIKWLSIFNRFFHKKVFCSVLLTVQIILTICPLIGFLLPSGSFRRFFQFLGNYYLGVMIYAFLILLSALILKKLFKKFIIKHNSNRIYAISGLVCLLLLFIVSIYGVVNARIIHVKNYSITINKKSNIDSLKLVMIADLHMGYNIGTKHIKRMVNKIKDEKPDILLIAGDIFDNEYDAIENPSEVIKLLKSINPKYGMYAVYGNHDINERVLMGFTFFDKKQKMSDAKMDDLLKKSGVRLLRDESILIADSFYIYGRPDYSRLGRGIKKRKNPDEMVSNLDTKKSIIVLDHQPRQLQEMSKNIDISLSGHTHDGQIFPLNLLMRLVYKNSYGLKKINNMTSIVTSGVGIYGPNMRVFTKAEITSIKINFKS